MTSSPNSSTRCTPEGELRPGRKRPGATRKKPGRRSPGFLLPGATAGADPCVSAGSGVVSLEISPTPPFMASGTITLSCMCSVSMKTSSRDPVRDQIVHGILHRGLISEVASHCLGHDRLQMVCNRVGRGHIPPPSSHKSLPTTPTRAAVRFPACKRSAPRFGPGSPRRAAVLPYPISLSCPETDASGFATEHCQAADDAQRQTVSREIHLKRSRLAISTLLAMLAGSLRLDCTDAPAADRDGTRTTGQRRPAGLANGRVEMDNDAAFADKLAGRRGEAQPRSRLLHLRRRLFLVAAQPGAHRCREARREGTPAGRLLQCLQGPRPLQLAGATGGGGLEVRFYNRPTLEIVRTPPS